MKKYKFIINTSFNEVTLNKYINKERTNRAIAANLKKKMQNKIKYLASALKFRLPKNTKFDVLFVWYKPNNRTDHDNISFCQKFVFDALVEQKVLESDSPKFINNIAHTFEIDKSRRYISCVVIFSEKSKYKF